MMIEADGNERVGKNANREFEKQFTSSIAELHGGGVTGITSNEETETTVVETWMDASFKDGKRIKKEQACVQQWQGDQIIRERFYYNMPGQN